MRAHLHRPPLPLSSQPDHRGFRAARARDRDGLAAPGSTRPPCRTCPPQLLVSPPIHNRLATAGGRSHGTAGTRTDHRRIAARCTDSGDRRSTRPKRSRLPTRTGTCVHGQFSWHWNGVADSVLARLVAEQRLPEDGGYCWVGAEASQARAIRKYLRIERGWRPDQSDILGYWRRHSERWDARYAQVGPELF